MKESPELPSFLVEHIPWGEASTPIWPATLFVLRRNIARYNFPGKLHETQSVPLLEILTNGLASAATLKEPILLRAQQLKPLDKEFLFEHFLCLEGFQNTFAGQGFVVDASSLFLALLNIEDHMQLQIMDCKGQLEETWNCLSALDTAIGKQLNFAYSDRFGYLTADPGQCGTALHVLIYLHLPALIHGGTLQETLAQQGDEGLFGTSIEGSTEELVGDILILRNRYTFGLSEESLIHTLQTAAMKLMIAEKTARSQLQHNGDAQWKDQISRAYGLLMHSFQLQTKETLSALSMIKLGLDLGWLEGISDPKMNEIFFRCRRAHLLRSESETPLDPQQLYQRRAAFTHRELAPLKVHI